MVIARQSRSNLMPTDADVYEIAASLSLLAMTIFLYVIASPSGRGDLLTFSAFLKIAASLSLLATTATHHVTASRRRGGLMTTDTGVYCRSMPALIKALNIGCALNGVD